MTWARQPQYDHPQPCRVRSISPDLVAPEVELDLHFDAIVIDSLIRGLPLGLITVLRARVGGEAVDVVVDGARRVAAIRRHILAPDGWLKLDFDLEAIFHAGLRPGRTTYDVLGPDEMAMYNAEQGLERRMVNRMRAARDSVSRSTVIVQTVITRDMEMVARRLGHADRVAWIREQIG